MNNVKMKRVIVTTLFKDEIHLHKIGDVTDEEFLQLCAFAGSRPIVRDANVHQYPVLKEVDQYIFYTGKFHELHYIEGERFTNIQISDVVKHLCYHIMWYGYD